MQEETEPRRLEDTLKRVLPMDSHENNSVVTIKTGSERYAINELIGEGGMGRVLAASDEQFGRVVAFKEGLVSEGGPHSRRFFQEAVVTGNLEHPGIPVVYERGVTPEGRPFYVMTKLRGRTLGAQIDSAETSQERLKLVSVVIKVAETLAFAHERGVIHRDIKPDNIIVGEFGEVFVVDWGIAKVDGVSSDDSQWMQAIEELRNNEATVAGQVLGTPTHMSPEQAAGRVANIDARTDVFALGALLYHIISGACPYRESNTASTILKASHAEYTPLLELAPDTEPALIRVVERAMSLKRSDRQADAKKFAEELKAWLADSTTKREGRSMTDTFASGLSALLLAFMLLGFGLVLAMTPLTSIGPTALVVLIFGSLGCVLSLLEWQTKGRHHLSHLCLALAAVTFLVGLANTALGELQVHTVGMKLDSSLDKEEAMRGLAAGRKIVLQSIPIVLIMTAMQLSLWAVVKRMIDRASLKEARS